MCTACVFPINTGLTEDEFENCWNSNEDGGGFSYIDEGGKLVIFKSLDLDELKKLWKEHHTKHSPYSPFLLHFRAASAGLITTDNCHPFSPNPKVAFIHNGTIHKMPNDKERSDTRIFSEDYLTKLPHNFLNNPTIMVMMAEYLGTNKIAFLGTDGETLVTNKSQWVTHNDALFSNTFYKIKRTRTSNSDPTGMAMNFTGCGYTPPKQSTSIVHKPTTYHGQVCCDGCLLIVDKINDKWDHQRQMCRDCSNEVNDIAKMLKISEWKAKEIFLEAAKTHPSKLFYSKMSEEEEVLEEIKEEKLEVVRDQKKIDEILNKPFHTITITEWDYLNREGVYADAYEYGF